MADIQIRYMKRNGHYVDLEVPDDMIVDDIMDQLVQRKVEKSLGFNEEWPLYIKETGGILDVSKSLAENGVSDGDCICIGIPGGTAG